MNRFTHENRFVLDAADKPWPVNQWHPWPPPRGVEVSAYYPVSLKAAHWLVQAPLPPVPVDPKPEDVAFDKWLDGPSGITVRNAWNAGIDYARKNR